MWLTLPQVSSVTQTTVTEKEVLFQLLQEKDQLQREQEDRIKNLTKLLVTSSNEVPVHKVILSRDEAVKTFPQCSSDELFLAVVRCRSAG